MLLSKQVTRRAIVFAADICIFYGTSLFFAFISKDTLAQRFDSPMHLLTNILFLHVFLLIFQLLFRTYDSLWRYAAHREYFALLVGVICGASLYEISQLVIDPLLLESSFVWAVSGFSALLMLAMRFCYRIYQEYKAARSRENDHRKPVAIVGAGRAGLLLLNEFTNNLESRYRPVCFFDDAPEKQHKRIQGILVQGTISDIPTVLADSEVRHILVAMPSQPDARITDVLRTCTQVKGMDVQVLPGTIANMAEHTQPLSPQLRKVQIADLLGRKQISLQDETVAEFLAGRVVMVTGGGGSIGSELCRQIAAANPKTLIILDIYENNAYDIQQELRNIYGDSLHLCVEIASIRDKHRIDTLFDLYRPEIVFHAAAHKHVPLMEHAPQEAIRNNVFGTYNVVLAAHTYGVKKFVQISTDKAVNPTNVMGATKRMCEMIEQSMGDVSKTEFVAVRFGNVLGSNGSVIPLFNRQIAEGGPITLTDKRIIRYFMTIPEAAQLVLKAGALAEKNQVFVLDMGDPIKILDLAENLIRLSGLEPYKDIDIQEVGLRPGEKLFEELLIGDNVIPTKHDLIFTEEQPHITSEALEQKLTLLRDALATDDNDTIVQALRIAVPTFKLPQEVNADFHDPNAAAPSPDTQSDTLQQRTVIPQ